MGKPNTRYYVRFIRSYYPRRQDKASLINTLTQAHTENNAYAAFISGMFCRLPPEKQIQVEGQKSSNEFFCFSLFLANS